MDTQAQKAYAEVLLKRRSMRANLVEWARFLGEEKGWTPAKHHLLLLEKLQAITDGTLVHSKTGKPCTKLMVLMPPGSAKSSYTSIIFPVWFLQRFSQTRKNCRILACSFAADLIESFSRECRNTVDNHSKVLGYNLQADSRAVQEWNTTNGCGYRCAGVGAGISGRRADCGLIDDYIGTEEDADSKTIRDKQWAWYQGDFWPRLKPGAIQIIVANRRHEDDLVGMLLEREGDEWEEVKIPYFAEDEDCLGRAKGERLWPEWFDEKHAEGVRKLSPRVQAGLYQQRPAPEDGDYFTSDVLVTYNRETYDRLSRLNLSVHGAGDWACSEEKGANPSCFGGAVMDEDGLLYILPDIFWKIAGPKETVTQFIEFLKRRNPLNFWSEKGQISKSWGPFLREQMLQEEVYNHITEVTPARSKEVRAQSIRGRMSMQRVRFPEFASWWEAARHQLLTFPGGKNDDFVDFIAHLGMGINSITKSHAVKEPQVESLDVPFQPTIKWIRKSDEDKKRKSATLYSGR